MSTRPLLALAAPSILGLATLGLAILGVAGGAAAQGFTGGVSSSPVNTNRAVTIPNGPYLTNMPTLSGGPGDGGNGQFTTQGAPVTTQGSPGGHPAVVNRGFGPFGRSGMQSRPQAANPGADTVSPAAALRPQNSWAFRRAR